MFLAAWKVKPFIPPCHPVRMLEEPDAPSAELILNRIAEITLGLSVKYVSPCVFIYCCFFTNY